MIEVIFARRLLAISRHRDFPTEPTSRADIQSLGPEKNARASKNFCITLLPLVSAIFRQAVEVSLQDNVSFRRNSLIISISQYCYGYLMNEIIFL